MLYDTLIKIGLSAGQKVASKAAANLAVGTATTIVGKTITNKLREKNASKVDFDGDSEEEVKEKIKQLQRDDMIRAGIVNGSMGAVAVIIMSQLEKVINNSDCL